MITVAKKIFVRTIKNLASSSDKYLLCRRKPGNIFLSQQFSAASASTSILPKYNLFDETGKMRLVDLDRSYYVYPNDTPFCAVDSHEAFCSLEAKERRYAYYLSQASWYGSLIVLHQTSSESPLIFVLLRKLFKAQSIPDLKATALEKGGLTEDEFQAFLVYAAGIFYNMGNYKGFGDTKIVPNINRAKFEALIRTSRAYETEKHAVDEVLSLAMDKIYSLGERECRLGLGQKGVTTYHSSNMDENDTALIDRYMKAKKMEGWNTRLFKTVDEHGKKSFEIRLASVEGGNVTEPEEFENCLVKVTRGDYGPLLARVNHYLTLAKNEALNEAEAKMMEKYIEHFNTGSLDAHKNGSRFWIQDKGPVVESYIGFIENYRDPVGVRSEFEGFVAVVNKVMSAKFAKLVENAETLLARMPWDKAYEKDKFLRPDFTSLDVVCFGGSGIPSGINIPNYDEIRQLEGFKNVSLGNIIAAFPNIKITFLNDADQAVYKKYHQDSFELQVGLHELLGHGSGKLFQRRGDGKYNFDMDKVVDMETGGKITSWYEDGETWSTKFGGLASAYEECRAEAVGYFLCTFPDVLSIFGFEGQLADDIKYANWLSEVLAGLKGLEFYSPEKKSWGQAHCHARFVLLMVALEGGEDFVRIKEFTNPDDGKPDLLFTLDKTKIDTVGRSAVGAFLKKLQLHKTTGDFAKGKALFDRYSEISEKVLHWREIVVARRQPRRILVLPNTIMNESDKTVSLKMYLETAEGAVLANVERYTDDKIEQEIYDLWKKDAHHFQY